MFIFFCISTEYFEYPYCCSFLEFFTPLCIKIKAGTCHTIYKIKIPIVFISRIPKHLFQPCNRVMFKCLKFQSCSIMNILIDFVRTSLTLIDTFHHTAHLFYNRLFFHSFMSI